jgi:predicted membrane protein
MAKEKGQKDKQHNGQKKMAEAQATQWPKEKDRRTSNSVPFLFGHCVVCLSVLFFWSLRCLSFWPFLLVIVLLFLLPFYFGHCVACPSALFFWPLCCLSFCPFVLVIVLNVLLAFSFGHCVQHNGQKEKGQKNKQHNGQKKKNRRTSNTMDKRKGTESKATQ